MMTGADKYSYMFTIKSSLTVLLREDLGRNPVLLGSVVF